MRNLYNKLFVLFLGVAPVASAQYTIDPQNCREGESVEYCHQHVQMNEILKDPQMAASWKQSQKQLDQELKQYMDAKAKGDVPGKGIVYRVPVVFHVLHNGGSENISREQIINCMQIWNRDFRRLNADADNVHADFQGMPSDVEIEFVLATKAPDGTCFSGITRTVSTETYSGNGTAQRNAVANGNDVYQGNWPSNKYLNVFVCQNIGGAAGYSNYPNNFGTDMRWGIFVLHNYVGAIGTSSPNASRTMTHEAGHWLNLPHVWGNSNNPGLASNCSQDDGVQDTPECIGVSTCNLSSNTCSGDNSYWGTDKRDNVENYMDYSYCSKMYTPGQVARMRAAIQSTTGGRNNLWTPANIAATGADSNFVLCKAEFEASTRVVCTGSTVNFSDLSYNSVSGWNWSFPGGSPATSTSQNPTVTYSTPGTYAVTLTSTDGGTSQTTTKTNYITVLPGGSILPYAESFENYTVLDQTTFWKPATLGTAETWELYTSDGATGTKSLRIHNYNSGAGNQHILNSGNFDLSNLGTNEVVTFSFKYAYKKRNSSNNEILRFKVSSDCGEFYSVRKTISNNSLSSEVSSSEYTPVAGDWVQVHVPNITSNYFINNLQTQFEFTSDNGNNFYLDDINFYRGDQNSLGLENLESVSDVTVFPNPADELVNLQFVAPTAGTVVIEVRDITGKLVETQTIKAQAGTNLVLFDTNAYANGMYMMNIRANGSAKTIQFAVK